jgi:hypothetical protein
MSEAPETEPTEGVGEEAAAEEAVGEGVEASDEARHVSPDEGGHQYEGDDSAAQVSDSTAAENE